MASRPSKRKASRDTNGVPLTKKTARFANMRKDHQLRISALPEHLEQAEACSIEEVARERVPEVPTPRAHAHQRRRGVVSFREEGQVQVYSSADGRLDELLRESEGCRRKVQEPSKESDTNPKDEILKMTEEGKGKFFREIVDRMPFWESIRPQSVEEVAKKPRAIVPAVHADHVHRFLVRPHGRRRECIAREECIARTLPHPNGPLTAVEFLTEEEEATYQQMGNLPANIGLCYFCHLYLVSYVNTVIARTEVLPEKTYTAFHHIVERPGEYTRESCIQPKHGSSEGILHPFRLFCKADYIPVLESNAHRDPMSPLLRDDDGKSVPGWREVGSVFF